jgi:ceramide glucosyltransferase
VALIRIAHWPCSARGIVALVVRDAMLPAIWIATWFGRRVVWHGTTIAPNRPD